MTSVHFFYEDTPFQIKDTSVISQWIQTVFRQDGLEWDELNYIFCSDTYLHQINLEYLQHDAYTDIITFDLSEDDFREGEIYISIDRVDENARKLNVPFEQELHRVIIHGVLHLMGYGDKSQEESLAMRKKEEACLSLLP